MIPSRPLDLGGIIGESIRIVKLTYWRATLIFIILALPGILLLSIGIDKTIDSAKDVTAKFTSVSAETPNLARDYFVDRLSGNQTLWLYRLEFPEAFAAIDSAKVVLTQKYSDSASSKISARLDSIATVVSTSSAMSTEEMLVSSFSGAFVLSVLGILLYLIGYVAAIGGLLDLTSRAFEERPIVLAPIFRLALSRSVWLLLGQYVLVFLAIITGFSILVGIMAAISPVLGGIGVLAAIPVLIYTGIRTMFCSVALVSEELRPFEAIKRSITLTFNSFGRVLGITIIAGILIYIVSLLISLPVSLMTSGNMDWFVDFIRGNLNVPLFFNNIKSTVELFLLSSFISSALTIPFFPAFITTLYYDLRTRREGPLEYHSEPPNENSDGF